MKALILNGSSEHNAAAATIQKTLNLILPARGWQVTGQRLREVEIAPCLGCFDCWTKTPGICIQNDAGREIARQLIQSELLILLTPITFGTYSYHLKKALDRIIPNVLPFFKQINGEIHHKKRYNRYPHLLALGTLPAPDDAAESSFRKLVARNAINFHTPHHAVGIITGEPEKEELHASLLALLTQMEVL